MPTAAKEKLVEGKYTVKSIFDKAEEVVIKKTKGCKVFNVEAEDRIPKFQMSELTLGRVLGRGGFCVVSEVARVKLASKEKDEETTTMDDEHAIYNIVQNRAFMEAHCLRGKGKDCRYALKILQDSSRNDAQTFINGVVDLAVEARFLSVIRHPNIIKMRAMAITSPYSVNDPFFVVLDRLYDILGQRITKWKKKRPSGIGKMMDRKGKKSDAFWLERITVGYDLACALQYLHDMDVIYRDLKPDNIGFDVRGDVKIFDFGLAKEIDPTKKDANGTYNLTGDTGSPRYMATEIAMEKPYNELCDVYSFSILLWQILEMETPFASYTMSMFKKKVVLGGHRPLCNPKWPKEIVDMLKSGWGEPRQRPSMRDVVATLREEVGRYDEGGGDASGELLDASRKSELSLRGNKAYMRKSVLSMRALEK